MLVRVSDVNVVCGCPTLTLFVMYAPILMHRIAAHCQVEVLEYAF